MARRTRRTPLTDAERDARRHADRERLEHAARALLTSDGWQRWIKLRASNGLSRYSLRNQWLIAIGANARGFTPTYVAGFRAFLQLNRCVRPGERAIHILAPVTARQRDERGADTGQKRVFFRTVPVFDVSMTDPLPGTEPADRRRDRGGLAGQTWLGVPARGRARRGQARSGQTAPLRVPPEGLRRIAGASEPPRNGRPAPAARRRRAATANGELRARPRL